MKKLARFDKCKYCRRYCYYEEWKAQTQSIIIVLIFYETSKGQVLLCDKS